jgi:hypothetical protein
MKKTVIMSAVLASACGLATAGFDAEFNGITGVDNAININNTGTGGFINLDFDAGHNNFTYTDVGGMRGIGQFAGGSFVTFCIELQNTLGGSRSYAVDDIENSPNPSPGNGGPQYDSADEAEVNAVVAAAVRLGWINSDLTAGAGASNDRLAAIQGMIWKVVLDEAVVTGNGSVGTEMAALQTEIDLQPNATVSGLVAMLNADSQDQLFIVPLPTAAFAGLMMLGGLAGVKRLRRS